MDNEYFELVMNLPKQVSQIDKQIRFDLNPNLILENSIVEGRVLVDDLDPIKDEIEQWHRLLYDTNAISLIDSQGLKVSATIYKYNEQCLLVGKWNLVGVYPIFINKRIYKDKEFFGLSAKSYIMYIDFSFGNYLAQEI